MQHCTSWIMYWSIWHNIKSVTFSGLVRTQYGVSNSLLAKKIPLFIIDKVELSVCMPWGIWGRRNIATPIFTLCTGPSWKKILQYHLCENMCGLQSWPWRFGEVKICCLQQELDHSSSITQPATKTEWQTDSTHNIWLNYLPCFRITDNLNFPCPLTETHLYMHLQQTEEVWTQWFRCLGRLFFGLRSL